MRFDHATDYKYKIHIAAETLRIRFGREANWADRDPDSFLFRGKYPSVFVMRQY